MPPARLARIVGADQRAQPDLVLIAGDFVSDKASATRHYSTAEAVAPLAGLAGAARRCRGARQSRSLARRRRAAARSRWRRRASGARPIDAAPVGPLAIGGLDDALHRPRPISPRRSTRCAPCPAPRILLEPQPRPVPALAAATSASCSPATPIAARSGCLSIGALQTISAYGQRYACGLVRENGRTLIVTAGLGTSILPLRLGAAARYLAGRPLAPA